MYLVICAISPVSHLLWLWLCGKCLVWEGQELCHLTLDPTLHKWLNFPLSSVVPETEKQPLWGGGEHLGATWVETESRLADSTPGAWDTDCGSKSTSESRGGSVECYLQYVSSGSFPVPHSRLLTRCPNFKSLVDFFFLFLWSEWLGGNSCSHELIVLWVMGRTEPLVPQQSWLPEVQTAVP